jgi:hypothetical protein
MYFLKQHNLFLVAFRREILWHFMIDIWKFPMWNVFWRSWCKGYCGRGMIKYWLDNNETNSIHCTQKVLKKILSSFFEYILEMTNLLIRKII